MASTSATPVVTGNPNSMLRNNSVYTATYTAHAPYDTVTIPGGVRVTDTFVVEPTSTNADTRYVGLCEVAASRSASGGTIRVAPLATAPSSAVTYRIVRIRV